MRFSNGRCLVYINRPKIHHDEINNHHKVDNHPDDNWGNVYEDYIDDYDDYIDDYESDMIGL